MPFSHISRCAVALLFCTAAACDGEPTMPAWPTPLNDNGLPIGQSARPADTSLSDGLTIGVYVGPSDYITEEDVAQWCDFWSARNISCFSTDEAHADYVVEDDNTICPEHDGNYTLASTGYDAGADTWSVIAFTPCYELLYGDDAKRQYLETMAHEFGHTLGIVVHIPAQCDDESVKDAPRDADGHPVCGPALMNPNNDPGITVVTENDLAVLDAAQWLGLYSNVVNPTFGRSRQALLAEGGDFVTVCEATARLPH